MKLFTLIALVGGAAALRLHHHQQHTLLKTPTVSFLGLKNLPQLTPEQAKEIEDWVKKELKGDGTITKKEAEEGIKKFAAKHGFDITADMWTQLEGMFDAADCDGNGELDKKEVRRSMKGKGCKGGNKGGSNGGNGDHGLPELTMEQKRQFSAWATEELKNGGTITKEEAQMFIHKFAQEHNLNLTHEQWMTLEKMFDDADVNNDGQLDLQEFAEAMNGGPPQGGHGPPGGGEPLPQLTPDQLKEMENWARSEVSDGGTITAQEAEDFFKDFDKRHNLNMTPGQWKSLENMMAAADTNNDMQLDAQELERAMGGGHGGDNGGGHGGNNGGGHRGGPDGLPELTMEQKHEFSKWATEQLMNGGTITKEEAGAFLYEFAQKHNLGLTHEQWQTLEKMFDDADTNNDGQLNLQEFAEAMNGGPPQGGHGPPQGGHGPPGEPLPQLTPDQLKELENWARSEVADGGTITAHEAYEFFNDFVKRHNLNLTEGQWKSLENMMAAADTNNDMQLDAQELERAMGGGHGGDNGGNHGGNNGGDHGPPGEPLPPLTPDQAKEFENWAKSEVANGGTITAHEGYEFVTDFLKRHNITLSPGQWRTLENMMARADTNNDMQIDAEELRAMMGGDHGRDHHGGELPELTMEQKHELSAWATEQLKNGGTITKEEAGMFLYEFDKKHNLGLTHEQWQRLENMFDDADKNNDGELDLQEFIDMMNK